MVNKTYRKILLWVRFELMTENTRILQPYIYKNKNFGNNASATKFYCKLNWNPPLGQ
jgi:hypothetical protein